MNIKDSVFKIVDHLADQLIDEKLSKEFGDDQHPRLAPPDETIVMDDIGAGAGAGAEGGVGEAGKKGTALKNTVVSRLFEESSDDEDARLDEVFSVDSHLAFVLVSPGHYSSSPLPLDLFLAAVSCIQPSDAVAYSMYRCVFLQGILSLLFRFHPTQESRSKIEGGTTILRRRLSPLCPSARSSTRLRSGRRC